MVFLNRKSLLVMCIAGSLLQGPQLHAWSFSDVRNWVIENPYETAAILGIAAGATMAALRFRYLADRTSIETGITPEEVVASDSEGVHLMIAMMNLMPEGTDLAEFTWSESNGEHFCNIRTLQCPGPNGSLFESGMRRMHHVNRALLVAEVLQEYPQHRELILETFNHEIFRISESVDNVGIQPAPAA